MQVTICPPGSRMGSTTFWNQDMIFLRWKEDLLFLSPCGSSSRIKSAWELRIVPSMPATLIDGSLSTLSLGMRIFSAVHISLRVSQLPWSSRNFSEAIWALMELRMSLEFPRTSFKIRMRRFLFWVSRQSA